jgi:hypothetical protein
MYTSNGFVNSTPLFKYYKITIFNVLEALVQMQAIVASTQSDQILLQTLCKYALDCTLFYVSGHSTICVCCHEHKNKKGCKNFFN